MFLGFSRFEPQNVFNILELCGIVFQQIKCTVCCDVVLSCLSHSCEPCFDAANKMSCKPILVNLGFTKAKWTKKKTFFTDSYAGYCCVPQLPYPVRLKYFVQRTVSVTCRELRICMIFLYVFCLYSFVQLVESFLSYHSCTCISIRNRVIKTLSLQW